MRLHRMIVQSAFFVGFILAFATHWTVDSGNAKVGFSVNGPFGTVHGSFTGLKASIQFDEKDLAGSSVSASIDAKTVNSGVGLRNKHLRNEEQWFNTEKYPEIRYRSQKIEKTKSGYKAIGELTIKDHTKPVEIEFSFTPGGDGGVFKGKFEIKREEFGLGKAGGSVGSVVTVDLDVPVKK